MHLSIAVEAFNLIGIMLVYIQQLWFCQHGLHQQIFVNEARLNFIINELFVLCEFK